MVRVFVCKDRGGYFCLVRDGAEEIFETARELAEGIDNTPTLVFCGNGSTFEEACATAQTEAERRGIDPSLLRL